MAHVKKFTKAACGHMFAHYDRQAEHISNENVDRTKTHLNYNLAVHQQMLQGEFVKQRCSEVKCQNRKDVNVMCAWVVTAPKELHEEEYERFFKAVYKFLEDRYGKDNVVSAWVHMDENQPHIHFAFVPVIYDAKKDIAKVSAKVCVSRRDLQTFHTDLDKYLTVEFGRSVGVLNGVTKEGNVTIPQLKEQQKKADELAKLNEEIEIQLKARRKPLEDIIELDTAKPIAGLYKSADVNNMADKAIAFDELRDEYNKLKKSYDKLSWLYKALLNAYHNAIDEVYKLTKLNAALQYDVDGKYPSTLKNVLSMTYEKVVEFFDNKFRNKDDTEKDR